MIRGSDVTVIIATIPERHDLLHRAVASVVAQNVKPGKLLIGNDKERRGAAWTRNRLVEDVETDWIAVLDDDDEFLPNHIRTLVRGANLSGADLIFTYAEFVGGRDPLACLDDRGVLVPEPIGVPFGPTQERSLRTLGNFIPATVLMRTTMVRKVGGYPEPYSFGLPKERSGDCEDYGLLLKLLDAGAIFHHVCGVRTWIYHQWEGNLGGRGLDRMHELS